MAKNVYVEEVTRSTPQTKPIRGRESEMARNNAGGYSFMVGDWVQLERFLILGAEGGTFYVKQSDLVFENVDVLDRCIAADPDKTAEVIASVSESGRAYREKAILFALSYMVAQGGKARSAAFREGNRVLRTGRALHEFHRNLEDMHVPSTMSRRKFMARWMTQRKASELAYQMIKYPSSGHRSMRDLVLYAHPNPVDDEMARVLAYLVGQEVELDGLPRTLCGWDAIKHATSAKEAAKAVTDYRLTWEFVPGEWQGSREVWEALLPQLPFTALIRNLGRMSSYGMLNHGTDNARFVQKRLTDAPGLTRARIHPMALLVALRTYEKGRGDKGNMKWTPTWTIRDALEEGFYLAFDALEPTGKSFLIGIDVSASMNNSAGGLPIKCNEAAAVMAMVSLRTEPQSVVMAFDDGIRDLRISKHDSLQTVLKQVKDINYGGTDCSLPTMHALDNGMMVDEFVVLTDNETYAGDIHPSEALKKYRELSIDDAKLVVVGMTATRFSIADPADAGMLDVVGMSPDVPALISRFAVGL